ncbi:MAG: hypothetical protein ACI97A_002851 [Planctomycetota bacterium]
MALVWTILISAPRKTVGKEYRGRFVIQEIRAILLEEKKIEPPSMNIHNRGVLEAGEEPRISPFGK